MRIDVKSEKGAITLVVLVGMIFLTVFLMSLYIQLSNKAQTSSETTKQIAKQYNNIGDADIIYDNYFANIDIIPIYEKEQLAKIGSNEKVLINNKIYTFELDAYYILKNDLDLGGKYDEETGRWSGEEEWTPITDEFTGTLDGLGHTITGLYINNTSDNQGLFGELNGTVKNLIIENSYVNGKTSGLIAGQNEGTIENCVDGIKNYNDPETEFDNKKNGVLKENAYWTDVDTTGKEIARAIIPAGFKVIEGLNNTKTIAEGLVIQDAEGNEFVWIPVEVTKSDTKTSIASFYRSYWVSNEATGGKRGTDLSTNTFFSEPYASGYAGEEADYYEMLESVYKNGGFYIGRYEAGTESPRDSSTTGTTEGWMVQRNCYPYVYVGWGSDMNDYTSNVSTYGKGALYLCKNFYMEEDKVGVTSTLCYGVMWDAMLDFIKDSCHDVKNSISWGNYQDNAWEITNENVKGTIGPSNASNWKAIAELGTKTDSNQILLTTGASDSFAAKNIYDVAGNVREWTNEAGTTDYRIPRSGCWYYSGKNYPASNRYTDYCPNYCFPDLGFRLALYIK